MKRTWVLFLIAAGLTTGPTLAQAGTFQVGGCLKGFGNFLSIQTAVTAVPSGSTIFVCPGTYYEQVTISQPLTLRGTAFSNQDRPVIALPAAGIGINATDTVFGKTLAAQVVVQNPSGNVSLIDLTIDGSGDTAGCSGGELVGIFVASGASSSIDGVTVRNQQNAGCAVGIWTENSTGISQTVRIENDSIHDFSAEGILAVSNQNPSTLTVNIQKDSVTSTGTGFGIFTSGVLGTISNNIVTGTATGIYDGDFFFQSPGITISNNALADILSSSTGTLVGTAIALREGDTANSNKISHVTTAFWFAGGASANPGPTLGGNTVKNTGLVIEYNCTVNTKVASNNFNDSYVLSDSVPTGFVIGNSVNPFYNIDTLQTGSCP